MLLSMGLRQMQSIYLAELLREESTRMMILNQGEYSSDDLESCR